MIEGAKALLNRVLIVEDEEKLSSLLNDYLSQSGFTCHVLSDGNGVVEFVRENEIDMILLDIMLPGKDGIEICKELRQFSQVPIFMLTAKVEEIDRLLGLELGADDYICKPYSPREVVAKVKAMMRRQGMRMEAVRPDSDAKLTLDEKTYRMNWLGQEAELTAIEFQLVAMMLKEPGRIFNREQLMRNMYDDNRIVSNRTIDSHIKKLRKKLNEMNPNQELVQSVYGVGYKLILD